jgi:peptide/nickel transport system substrate-binding protein
VLALLLGACTGGADEDNGAAVDAAPDTGTATGTDGDAAPAADGEEKVLNVHLYQEPRRFNPLDASHGPDALSFLMIYDRLVSTNGDYESYGSMTESWEISDDATTFTFVLRDGLEWQNGDPVTSADVKFSYDLYANPAAGSAHVATFASVVGAQDVIDGNAEEVAGFTTPDDQTFVIELTEGNVGFLSTLVGPQPFPILPEYLLGDVPPEELPEHEFWDNPTEGLGPYRFVRYLPDQFVELERNPSYRAPVDIDRIFMRQATSDVATAQLATGEIDLASVSSTDMATVEGMDGVNVVTTPSPGFIRAAFNMYKERFQDPRVRQAFHYAVNREGIVEQVLGGQGEVINTPIMTDWALPDDLNTYPYDPELARQLLEEAGFDFDEPVELMLVAGTRDRDETATIIQGQLGDIGVDVSINNVEVSVLLERLDPTLAADGIPPYDLSLFGGGNYPPDPATVREIVACDAHYPGGGNFSYCNPEVDELIDAANQETDFDTRAEIYQAVAQILNEDLPYYMMYNPSAIYGVNQRLEGFIPHGDVASTFWNAGEWRIVDP